ncbi:hypothetical protein VTL71DRAFT_15489 [Oculimacula yallundae]|uniref:Uncharacterized protein n=1 Tax=Oculimacula yallundae TaxID=86028 RepID=A0ABR4CIU2_9HELO
MPFTKRTNERYETCTEWQNIACAFIIYCRLKSFCYSQSFLVSSIPIHAIPHIVLHYDQRNAIALSMLKLCHRSQAIITFWNF